MNNADKRAAEAHLLELQNNAADIFEAKERKLVKKNHRRIAQLKKYLKEEGKTDDRG